MIQTEGTGFDDSSHEFNSEILTLTRAAARRIDEFAVSRYAIPSLLLIEHASMACARLVIEAAQLIKQHEPSQLHSKTRRTVFIFAGPGNNGGDGLAIARHLAQHPSSHIKIVLFAEPNELKGDALSQYRMADALGLNVDVVIDRPTLNRVTSAVDMVCENPALHHPLIVVDAILGTGLSRPVSGLIAEGINIINSMRSFGAEVLAVDLPSGMDADTGEPMADDQGRAGPCVRADLTATFVAHKFGFLNPRSIAWTGHIQVCPIGTPRQLELELCGKSPAPAHLL